MSDKTADTAVGATPQVGSIARVRFSAWSGHVRHAPWGWRLNRRDTATHSFVQVSAHRSGKSAYAAVQQARFTCSQDEVIDVVQWVLGGWRIVEMLPCRREHSTPDDSNPEQEAVWSPTGDVIGIIEPVGSRTWRLMLPTPDPQVFRASDASSEAVHASRDRALATAHRVAGDIIDDPDWPARWQNVTRVVRHTTRGTAGVHFEFVGSAGVGCAYPGCSVEADTKLTLEGSDVAGEAPRMCCTPHSARAALPFISVG